jgi:type II secretory ATPase GspE/PulE/Tfp pilus assembly ATPase PilB-like protein
MVGEIRDPETLETAIEASLTGHLVLSTLHTNGAVATVTRLVEMGVEPYLLARSGACSTRCKFARILAFSSSRRRHGDARTI